MKLLGWVLFQYGWCPCRKWRQTYIAGRQCEDQCGMTKAENALGAGTSKDTPMLPITSKWERFCPESQRKPSSVTA